MSEKIEEIKEPNLKQEWNNDDIFVWRGGKQMNIFLHHAYTYQGYGTAREYINACLDLISSIALLQMTVFSMNDNNVKIIDKSNDPNWEQEWPKFDENDKQSCNLLLGTLYTENGMTPGEGRVFGTDGCNDKGTLFYRLFHEQDLGSLLLLKWHDGTWCRLPFYRKITAPLGYGLWKSIQYYFLKQRESRYTQFYGYNFPDKNKKFRNFTFRNVPTKFGLSKEVCLLNHCGHSITNTYELRKLIHNEINGVENV